MVLLLGDDSINDNPKGNHRILGRGHRTASAPEGRVRFLSLAEVNQDWRGLCGELGPEELETRSYCR